MLIAVCGGVAEVAIIKIRVNKIRGNFLKHKSMRGAPQDVSPLVVVLPL